MKFQYRPSHHHATAKPLAVALALILGCAIGSVQAQQDETGMNMKGERFARGRILVAPKATLSDTQFESVVGKHGAHMKKRIQMSKLRVVEVGHGQEELMVQALAADPSVAFAELDRLVKPGSVTPNDPKYPSAWHLATMQLPSAWDNSYGNGVTVAVLDTGVDATHPDLAGKLVPGWNLNDNNSDTSDVHGHGTWVTGVVAAASNNGIGVTSIAWNSKVMPLRISMPDGMAYLSTIANGLYWAADHGAHIANVSYDALTGSSTIQSAAQYMRNKGGLVVVAAGNSGVQQSISNTPTMITVSATTSSDALASWSSYGSYVDVSAPGSGIWTTSKGGGYSAVNGTSFASPATAAVLALMKAANPGLSNTQLEEKLLSTTVDLGTPGYDIYFGAGRVNAAAAVAMAQQTLTPPPDTTAPSVSLTSPGTGSTISGTVAVNANASDAVGVSRVDFYAGTTLIGSDSSAPYSVSWDTKSKANGSYSLTAKALDAAGNQGGSSAVSVNVSNVTTADTTPPVATILSPGTGSTVTGTVKIDMKATDNIGVTKLECYVDGKLLSTTTASTLTCSWNTRKSYVGQHTLSALAKDAAGNTGTMHVTVTRK
jgi:hypothetical protein